MVSGHTQAADHGGIGPTKVLKLTPRASGRHSSSAKGGTMTSFLTQPTILLRVEAGAFLALGLLLYWKIGGNWLAFLLLLLVPDVSIVGYMGGARSGAAVYNLVHLYVLPSILSAIGIITSNEVTLSLALIWFSHINMDRVLGYGLKLPTGFKNTHLGTFGR
jgi:hypothetical protein